MFVLFFTWINPDLPCTILLADTVKLFCLLNCVQQVHWTPHGWLLPQILWSAGQKPPPPIFRIKVVHKGSWVGLYSELYDTSIAVWVVWVDSCGQNLFLEFIEYLWRKYLLMVDSASCRFIIIGWWGNLLARTHCINLTRITTWWWPYDRNVVTNLNRVDAVCWSEESSSSANNRKYLLNLC